MQGSMPQGTVVLLMLLLLLAPADAADAGVLIGSPDGQVLDQAAWLHISSDQMLCQFDYEPTSARQCCCCCMKNGTVLMCHPANALSQHPFRAVLLLVLPASRPQVSVSDRC
jgi:hypothetical protein